MDKYVINGCEIEFDTWDQTNLELFESERKRAVERTERLQKEMTDENAISSLREICETARDFFDVVLGEGMSNKIFGERMNAIREATAMIAFVGDVSENLSHPQIPVKSTEYIKDRQQTRDQERAAEREKRRMEAMARAGTKSDVNNVL